MDIQNKLKMELKERLGYKESVTLTRDEFNLLTEGDLSYAEELQEEINDLEEQLEEAQGECECDDLRSKLDRIVEIIDS